jgi:hypothetical protein
MNRGIQYCRFCFGLNHLKAAALLILLVIKESSGFSLNHVGSFKSSALKSSNKMSTNVKDTFHKEFRNGISKDYYQLSSSTVVEDFPMTSDEDFISMYSNNESLNDKPIDTKVGVLLLNLGGPEKTADVQGKYGLSLLFVVESSKLISHM